MTYNWNSEAAGTSPHTGFIAQQVLPILPDLVSQGPDGYYTMNYAGFTPYLIKAVQEIAAVSGAFRDNLIAWLGAAGNGIGDLFAKNGHFSNELCVGTLGNETCITKAQLDALLAGRHISGQTTTQQGSAGAPVARPSQQPRRPPPPQRARQRRPTPARRWQPPRQLPRQ